MGEIHEVFAVALSLVWFAGATPDPCLLTTANRFARIGPSKPQIFLGGGPEGNFEPSLRRSGLLAQTATASQGRSLGCLASDILFPLQPPPAPPLPRQTPRPSHPEKLDFGPFRLRLAPFRLRFGSVSGLSRVRFGSVSGCWGGVGVGSGRGASVREKNITMLGPIGNV